MNWIHSFFKKYQFQLWLIGCTSCEQLKQIIHDKNKKIEQIIASEPNYACWYAIDIIKGPWPPGEKAIASDPEYAYCYAMYIIEGPWPPGEKAIASEPNYACWYAIDIMVGPWPPGEKAIASDPFWKSRYDMICSC